MQRALHNEIEAVRLVALPEDVVSVLEGLAAGRVAHALDLVAGPVLEQLACSSQHASMDIQDTGYRAAAAPYIAE